MSNQYKKELLNALKKYNLVSLIKTQITKHKFNMLCTFDGTIVPGSIMTINQLAEIMNKRFDQVQTQFEEQKKFNELVLERFEDQKKFNALVLKRLDEHSDIFKRNNLK